MKSGTLHGIQPLHVRKFSFGFIPVEDGGTNVIGLLIQEDDLGLEWVYVEATNHRLAIGQRFNWTDDETQDVYWHAESSVVPLNRARNREVHQ
jgi:hypothetical protein